MKAMTAWICCGVCTALALLAGCPKNDPAQQPATQLPPGVTSQSQEQEPGAMTGLPAGVDEAPPVEAAEGEGNGAITGETTKVLLDSKRRLGGPYPNSTLGVFSAMLYDTAVERLDDVKALQELIDNGSAVFIPNGSEVEYVYETQFEEGFIAIRYEDQRWYVKAEDATKLKD